RYTAMESRRTILAPVASIPFNLYHVSRWIACNPGPNPDFVFTLDRRDRSLSSGPLRANMRGRIP
ncbi:MAG: hypothetical protein PHQ40_04700, partial [Anaerolineaceae bacterium]|nr:hypothetical protein [Anaerolineaceae bacterium]